MARSVLAMYADAGAPVPSVMMATDAMGADGTSGDHGGYGVMACDVSRELVLDWLGLGSRPGKGLSRLLPELFDERTRWLVFTQGRWTV